MVAPMVTLPWSERSAPHTLAAALLMGRDNQEESHEAIFCSGTGNAMTKVRVAGFSVSFDGFGAGPEQSLENPLGKRGQELHPWFIRTRSFQTMFGKSGGSGGVDDEYGHRSDGWVRRLYPWPQNVRPDPRSLAGRQLEGLVG